MISAYAIKTLLSKPETQTTMTNTNAPDPCANPDCCLVALPQVRIDLHYVLCPVCKPTKTRGGVSRGQQDESKETEEATANQQKQKKQRVVPPQNPRPAAARKRKRTKRTKRSLPPRLLSDRYYGRRHEHGDKEAGTAQLCTSIPRLLSRAYVILGRERV